MVIWELEKALRDILKENAAFEAKEIIMSVCGMSTSDWIINRKAEVKEEHVNKALEMAHRRISGEPLQYIIGKAGFMGMDFEVNKNTLIPRQDTETLIETLIDMIGDRKVSILDIGTGSGCIGISLGTFLKDARITVLDISQEALNTALRNADRNGVKIKAVCMDILSEIPEGKYDVIVSNPPYIETSIIKSLQTEVRDYEPLSALDGGSDGLLFYRRITDIAPRLLNEKGILAYEIGYDQGKKVHMLMEKDFYDIRIIKDYCGNDRVITGKKTGINNL